MKLVKYIVIYAVFFAWMPSLSLPQAAQDKSGTILSAFFGLDDSRQIRIRTIPACGLNPGRDGMPVIFSAELDRKTLDAGDFQVTMASGKVGRVNCATLRPADEPGERRTVLVIGDYGSADDQPVRVDIVGDLMSLDGGLNFKGAQATVIPLEAGPTMILAELVPQDRWMLGTRGHCPKQGIKAVVRVTWVGGITKPGGDEIDEKEMRRYRVTIRGKDGRSQVVTPLTVADLNDNDNNHNLCLGVGGDPVRIFFPAGYLTDPNEDLNPDTEISVSVKK